MPSKWPGEWEVAQVDFVQAVGSRSTVEARGRTARVRPSPLLQPAPFPALQVDLLPLKSIGDGLYRLSGRKPAAVRADIAKLGRLDSEYVREAGRLRRPSLRAAAWPSHPVFSVARWTATESTRGSCSPSCRALPRMRRAAQLGLEQLRLGAEAEQYPL